MSWVRWTLWCLFAMALTVASMPWLVVALGAGISGDEDAFNRIGEASPLGRLITWSEGRQP